MNDTATNTADQPVKMNARRMSAEKQEALRQLGFEHLKAGKTHAEIARLMGVHRNTVRNWALQLQEEGGEGFSNKKRGPKDESIEKSSLLTPEQQKAVYRMIVDKNPAQLKFDFALWTTRAIQELILRLYQIRISRVTICKYLKKWGMTIQRPKKRAIQQNPEAVEKWLKETYPEIARRAKREDALIFWEDETSIQQDTNQVRGYSPCGQTPILKQDRRNCYGAPVMISAVNNQGLVHFNIEKKAINAETFIEFLKSLIDDNKSKGKKLFVIVDNARIHHARIVKEWVSENSDQIELFYLPPYSPDYNPDEYLNRYLKTELRDKPAMTHAQSVEAVKKVMTRLKKSGLALIKKLFESEAVKYAGAWVDYTLCLPKPCAQ